MSDLSDLSGIERALFSTPYQIPIRRKKAVLVLLKKRVDAKSDAAFLSNHLPPLVYSLRFQSPAATDANYAQTNSPHNSAPMDGANFHLPLISSGESETVAIPTLLSVRRHNDRGEEWGPHRTHILVRWMES